MPGRAVALAAVVAGIGACGLALLAGSSLPFPEPAVHVRQLGSGRVLTIASPERRSPIPTPPPVTHATAATASATTSTDDTTTTTAAPTRGATDMTTSTTDTAGTASTTLTPVVTYAADIGVLAPREVAVATRLVVPALSVDGPVVPAGVDADNELDVPPDARMLAWYRHGPAPGEPGSAVIAGHLDWHGVRGHFADLAEMPLGASVTVVFSDGTQRDFTVSKVELALKPEVVAKGVFDPGGEPVLRLVTCGGEFEREIRSYRSNVIVTAVPA